MNGLRGGLDFHIGRVPGRILSEEVARHGEGVVDDLTRDIGRGRGRENLSATAVGGGVYLHVILFTFYLLDLQGIQSKDYWGS